MWRRRQRTNAHPWTFGAALVVAVLLAVPVMTAGAGDSWLASFRASYERKDFASAAQIAAEARKQTQKSDKTQRCLQTYLLAHCACYAGKPSEMDDAAALFNKNAGTCDGEVGESVLGVKRECLTRKQSESARPAQLAVAFVTTGGSVRIRGVEEVTQATATATAAAPTDTEQTATKPPAEDTGGSTEVAAGDQDAVRSDEVLEYSWVDELITDEFLEEWDEWDEEWDDEELFDDIDAGDGGEDLEEETYDETDEYDE
jgi:hypothetical protein